MSPIVLKILSGLSLSGAGGPGRGAAHAELEGLSSRNVDPVGEGSDNKTSTVADVLEAAGK
eukprot:463532-Hanusia_phi.AAC.2